MLNTCNVYKQLNQTIFSNLIDVGCQASVSTADADSVISKLVLGPEVEIGPESVSCSHVSDNSSVLSLDVGNSQHATSLSENVYDIAFSDISSAKFDDLVASHVNSTENSPFKPVKVFEDFPFSQFSAEKMVCELGSFSHQFSNRSALYFGKFPYRYKGGIHKSRDVIAGSYLDKLRCYLGVICPEFKFNSILIHLYENGKQIMPSHSDDEDCIEDDSDIVTVSLGATRKLVIREIMSDKVVCSTELKHGSVCVMSKSSQSHYKHEIIEDPHCKKLRLSFTFRLVKKPLVSDVVSQSQEKESISPNYLSSLGDTGLSGFVPFPKHPSRNKPKPDSQPHPRHSYHDKSPSQVLYISSSMFRHIDVGKLSSNKVKASKLFYRGANASIMLERLKKDLPLLENKLSAIYVMSGTNNVDSIYYGSRSLEGTHQQLTALLEYLKLMFPNAELNIINVLPRSNIGRNDVVRELNNLTRSYCKANELRFMETHHLFNTLTGKRKNQYFMKPSSKISDNCHLNVEGVARLGKYLKFWTHSHL
ncbi:hypothetical protein ACHWQZ_G011801, partial [Mnemiopsis leidyi]